MDKLKEDIKYWLAIGKNPKIGNATFGEILSKNLPLSMIYSMSKKDLEGLYLSKRAIEEILYCQSNIIPDEVIKDLEKREIKFTRIIEEDYPKELKEIYDPPKILYYKGTLTNNAFRVAIVGSRKPTQYGAEVTRELSDFLGKRRIEVVSGMAIGIDTIAHASCLTAGGRTIAVLGCGLDQIYPSRNVALVKEIIDNGAIISEFPVGVPPMKFNFPLRNRIISGLSKAVIITEATEKSGSLITATSALDQNKDIFAVPGSIYNLNSTGPNNLIRMGAKVITKPTDILEELGFEENDIIKELPKGETKEECLIIDAIKNEPKHIDLICKDIKIDNKTVSSTLTMMEITGKVRHLGGMVYKINY